MKVPPNLSDVRQSEIEIATAEQVVIRSLERWAVAHAAGAPTERALSAVMVFISPFDSETEYRTAMDAMMTKAHGPDEIEVQTVREIILLLHRKGKWFSKESIEAEPGTEMLYGLG